MEKKRLGELLIEADLLDQEGLQEALAQHSHRGTPLGATLVELGLVPEASMLALLSMQLRFLVVQLQGRRIAQEVLELISYEVAIKHHCIPLLVETRAGREELFLGMSDPTDLEAIDHVNFQTGLSVHPVLVSYSQLEDAIESRYRSLSFTVSLAEDIALQKLGVEAQRFVEEALGDSLEKLPDEAPGAVGPLLQALKRWRGLTR